MELVIGDRRPKKAEASSALRTEIERDSDDSRFRVMVAVWRAGVLS